MNCVIGIMQGRLLPPKYGKIQAFPADDWKEEFALAKEAGLQCIEWIYDESNKKKNPILIDKGVKEIRSLSKYYSVRINSLCADYFMKNLLLKDNGDIQTKNVDRLIFLIGKMEKLEIKYFVLPFVDSSSLRYIEQYKGLLQMLKKVIPHLEYANIELHLETDLKPRKLSSLLDEISHPLIKANYDIGNSASLGYNPKEEVSLIGSRLGSVHVKDRVLNGGTVPLGSGEADFKECFFQFNKLGFHGPFILQAAREEGISEVVLAKKNRIFVERFLCEMNMKL